MKLLHPLLTALLVLCLLCAQCSVAKPSASMTRIQEVFRTLMGAKPMMLASRGKKSTLLGGGVPNAREYLDEGGAETSGEGSSSYWIVADERLPVVAVRNYLGELDKRRRR